MRFHPVISIILGFFSCWIFDLTLFSLGFTTGSLAIISDYGGFLLGGFIASYFAKERKIQYGFYLGIILIIFGSLMGFKLSLHPVSLLIIVFLSSLGGFLGILTEKNIRKSLNKDIFNPFAIILVSFVTILFILGLSFLSTLERIYFINFAFIYLSAIFLGGWIVAWFSKENKIKHCIFYGLIVSFVLFTTWKGYFFKHYYLLILMTISAIVGGVIAENEEDTIIKLLHNKYRGRYKSFFINLYGRNKIYIIVPSAIFFASVLIGGVGTLLSGNFNHSMIKLYYYYVSYDGPLTTLFIFLNNSSNIFFFQYIGGVFLGFISIFHIVRDALVLGFVSVKDPVVTIFYVLPHGIFEFSGIIIATAAGFKLLITFINIIWCGLHIKRDKSISEQIKSILRVNYFKFRDSLILFIIAIIFIFIAAIIEANLTIPIAEHFIS